MTIDINSCFVDLDESITGIKAIYAVLDNPDFKLKIRHGASDERDEVVMAWHIININELETALFISYSYTELIEFCYEKIIVNNGHRNSNKVVFTPSMDYYNDINHNQNLFKISIDSLLRKHSYCNDYLYNDSEAKRLAHIIKLYYNVFGDEIPPDMIIAIRALSDRTEESAKLYLDTMQSVYTFKKLTDSSLSMNELAAQFFQPLI